MDLPIKKKKGIKRKHILIGVGVLVVGLLSFQAFFRTNVSTLNVDIEKLSVEQVSEGIFHDYFTVTGNVEPIATIFLDAREGGRVEEKVVEEGEVLKKGDIILRLSNPD
ncbi:MAG: efflux transporter periplasmic adaptor subunit, partial [Bacteroidetes bacterium CG_4_9_14_3_um_filter_41_19]